jgi:succinylglutamate desuccinylase
MKLQELEHLPKGLLKTEATGLEALLGGPTLIHLKGRQEPALFIAVLMHGNETSGWDAVRGLLGRYMGGEEGMLPRAVSLFIGNVSAAAQGLRCLDGQPDYNRVWPGSELPPTPEHGLMEQVVDAVVKRGLFASVDLHNNTGLNPHYACINAIDNRFLHLASMFSRTVVYFLRPRGVQSMAMAPYCPAVTLECGKVGHTYGSEHAMDYLDACLRLSEHPDHSVAEHDIDLFHTVAIVRVYKDTSFGFGEQGVNIQFADDLDMLNFRELPRGTSFGRVYKESGIGLEVRDEQGRDVTERYFALENDELRVRVPVMPSMLTKDHRVVRQDCLCYLMERYNTVLQDA